MQNRKTSLFESLTNTFTGMAVSFVIQLVLFPLMNIPVKIEQNIVIMIVFTGASIGRTYLIRRIFNSKCKCKMEEKILEIIENDVDSVPYPEYSYTGKTLTGTNLAAKEITLLIKGFIEWYKDQDIFLKCAIDGEERWIDVRCAYSTTDSNDISFDELFKYWLTIKAE